MSRVSVVLSENIGYDFISTDYLPEGKDEYYLRNMQVIPPSSGWRHLFSEEIELLKKNNNRAENWNNFFVTDEFDPDLIKNSNFYGLVRIGRLKNVILQYESLKLPAGITNSLIIASDIGDNVAIHNVQYLAHYIIGNNSIIFNIKEMLTSGNAKFGQGILKDGETEDYRNWIEVMNEAGNRRILPFEDMITADAYLWAKYIDDKLLQENLKKITQNNNNKPGYYSITGDNCVIKNSSILKDLKIGSGCYISGANELNNLTINSTEEEPTHITEGVELINGIIASGCHIAYESKAINFIMGNNCNLKYGARLFHSFLGDNSTIACCEVLNNLIFPAHEQHHNNSFLIASLLMGQSNIAAGATIGSNHNSRSNDNEIQAGRGFWPGLCSSLKHSSRFASFVLLSKADYPAELDIPFPFSLVNNNLSKDQLEIMPAYWWMYNMYALARNSSKFQARDKRIDKIQNIEFDAFAPDTIEEIIKARNLLEIFTAKAYLRSQNAPLEEKTVDELSALGQKLLSGNDIKNFEVLGENMENSKRKAVIIKPHSSYQAYSDMLHYYAVKNLLAYFTSKPNASLTSMNNEFNGKRQQNWINLGGQIMLEYDLDEIRSDIASGKLNSWAAIHSRYNQLWAKYQKDKQNHSYAILCELYHTDKITPGDWKNILNKAITLQNFVCEQVYNTRLKDYENIYRQATYRNREEIDAAWGSIEDNSFIIQIRKETEDFKNMIEEIKTRESDL